MSTPTYTFEPGPGSTGQPHPWATYVNDFSAGPDFLNPNRFVHTSAIARAPFGFHTNVDMGDQPWRGNQDREEEVLDRAAAQDPKFAAQLLAYEARLGLHTLSPKLHEALRDPIGAGSAGPAPSQDDVARAASQLRAGHMSSAFRQAAHDLTAVKKYADSDIHQVAWQASQHLRPDGGSLSWGRPPTKAQKKASTRFLVTQMGQELRGALALIEPPDGGEVGRRQVAEFDKTAEKLLRKRKNGGRDAVEFYREHANNPPPRLPPPGAELGLTVSTSPKTGPAAEQVKTATTALALGAQPSGREGAAPRRPGSQRALGIAHQNDQRTTGIAAHRG